VNRLAKLVRSQQDVLLDLFEDHKSEVEAKLVSAKRRFRDRQIEKQFDINTGFKKLTQKALVAVDSGEDRRAKGLLQDLLSQLETHEEDLLIADTSPHGWLAVAKIRSGSGLSKSLRKRLEQVDKELSAQKNRDGYGRAGGKSSLFSKAGEGPIVRRDQRRISPEEALTAAGKQRRAGNCSHCKKAWHFYRECPEFWTKVQESREEEAKKAAN